MFTFGQFRTKVPKIVHLPHTYHLIIIVLGKQNSSNLLSIQSENEKNWVPKFGFTPISC